MHVFRFVAFFFDLVPQYDPINEFQRMGVPNEHTRVTGANSRFAWCDTYPTVLAVPAAMTDVELTKVANFRSRGRLPVLTWKHPVTNACIYRCAQPRVGVAQSRCSEDERLLLLVAGTSANHRLSIFDARPRLNAIGNQIAGKGTEDMDYYKQCEIVFCNIENIHAVRDSYQKMAKLINRTNGAQYDNQWLSQVESMHCSFGVIDVYVL